MLSKEDSFKARIVQLILRKEVDDALEALSQHYKVDVPRFKVGMPKKTGGKAGCYVPNTKTIHVVNQEKLEDPWQHKY